MQKSIFNKGEMERNKKCLKKITKEAGKVPVCLQITISAERKP